MLGILVEMWLLALVAASTLFVGVIGAQALIRQVRELRARLTRPRAELTTRTV